MTDLTREPATAADDLSARLSSSLGRAAPKSPNEALQPEPVPPPPTRSRAVRHPLVVFFNFILSVVIIAVAVAGGALWLGKTQFEAPSDLEQARTFAVEEQTGLGAIADELQREGLVSSRWLFVAGVVLSQQQSNLKAGEYLIPAGASMKDIMDTMVSGRGILYSITIPEGLTSREIVARINADPILTGEIVEVLAEGSLLPETYKFTRGDTREELIERMRRERDAVLTSVWNRRASDLPISTPEELVVLASIVEKETALADERSRVAAVFINRLRLNMRLQSDPTVIYGMFKDTGRPPGFVLSRPDLDASTPYNTYLINGLPPGPIANPGRASLESIASPSRTRDLFFVADGTGGHVFAETYEEHLRNVARWRQFNNEATTAAAAQAVERQLGGGASDPASDAAGSADAPQGGDPPMALSPDAPAAAGDAPLSLQPQLRPEP